ncbi:MAG: hypothetical protein ABFC24_05305 [Methanoregulaceae archaeon]
MNEMAARYSLDRLVLVTGDGFTVAASDGDDPERLAASLAEAFRQETAPEDPRVILFPLEHRGSGLVCIACSGSDHSSVRPADIAKDVRALLDYAL